MAQPVAARRRQALELWSRGSGSAPELPELSGALSAAAAALSASATVVYAYFSCHATLALCCICTRIAHSKVGERCIVCAVLLVKLVALLVVFSLVLAKWPDSSRKRELVYGYCLVQ